MPAHDLGGTCGRAIDVTQAVVTGAARTLGGDIDERQVVAYDIAHAAAGMELAQAMLDYGEKGEVEARLACAFVADTVHDLAGKVLGREEEWATKPGVLDSALGFVTAFRDPVFLASLAGEDGPATSTATSRWCRTPSGASPTTRSGRSPSTSTAHNADIPEDVIAGLAEIGGFGLSVPEEYGGFAAGGESDYLGMVVATEELSRGSLGVGGSLITRPEILTRALVKGGTEEQKHEWLPASPAARPWSPWP